MPALKHIHIYVHRTSSTLKCDDPDCTTIISKADALGKRSRCSVCKEAEIILTRHDLRRKRPRCLACSDTKEARAHRDRIKLLEEMNIA